MNAAPQRVLIVDDLLENRVAFSAILKNEEYEIDLAESANEALGKLIDQDYICVLCDVQMPEIDGIEFAKIVRSDTDISDLPIVFITAHDYSPETLSAAFGLEAYDFIQKPVDSVILRSKLRIFSKLDAQRREIANQAAQLKESNHELDQFVRIASHDLRAPLRAISGLACVLKEDHAKLLPNEGKQILDTINSRVVRMGNLLKDLLTYSRAGKDNGQIAQLSFGELIENALGVLDVPASFAVATTNSEIVLDTYTTPLTTCIRNLIGNAIKHHDRTSGNIKVGCEDLSNCYEITVADDGPGIDPSHHRRIFTAFETLLPRDEVEGSGIGLSVVAKAVESVGGEIQIQSQQGQGALFKIVWPKHSK